MTAGDHTAALVARWVAWYTRHLPTEVAERRRAELASDLWEQRADARALGTPALAILRRMVVGMPADLRWRQEQLAVARGRAGDRGTWRGWRALVGGWWLGLAALVAVCQAAFGVATVRDVFPGAAARGLTLMAGGGLLMLGGLALRRRSRVASDLTVAAGALPGVPWIWTGSSWFAALAFSAITVVVAAAVDAAERHHLGWKGQKLGGDARMMLGNAIVFAALVVAVPVMMGGGWVGAGALVIILVGLPTYRRLRRFGRGG